MAAAESLTARAGLAAVLTEVPGASAVVRGGLVVYATELKAALAGVDPALLGRAGRRSTPRWPPTRRGAPASGAGPTWGLGLTGVAGPDPQDGVRRAQCPHLGTGRRCRPARSRRPVQAARVPSERDRAVPITPRRRCRSTLPGAAPARGTSDTEVRSPLAYGGVKSVRIHRVLWVTWTQAPVEGRRAMTVLLREAIGDRLRHARTNQRRTLRDISRAAGSASGYLSEVERGQKEASSELLAADLRRRSSCRCPSSCTTWRPTCRRWTVDETAPVDERRPRAAAGVGDGEARPRRRGCRRRPSGARA